MTMSLTAAIGIYFVLWWVVLFAVLPWGVKSQHEGGSMERGTDPGAPQQASLLKKAVVTTIVSAFIFGISVAVWESELIPFEQIPVPFPLPVAR